MNMMWRMIEHSPDKIKIIEKWEPYVRHILGVIERIEREEKNKFSLDKIKVKMVDIKNEIISQSINS